LGLYNVWSARHPRQSTLALTVADRQYAAVARPARLSVAPDEARHSLLTNDPHRGMRVVRLRDMQRDCAVICLPLQHYFQLHYCQSCNRPVVMEPHDGFAVCPECGPPRHGRGQAAFHHHGASVSGKTGMFAPLGRGGDVIEC
jgi:predicted RNA-binding Zn-ribbon protein involved in translation (DUF1610 family)